MNSNHLQITIIGSGHVATVLAMLAHHAGHTLAQVFSRHHAHAAALAGLVGAEPVSRWQHIKPGAHLYLVAISDAALSTLHEQWQMPGAPVAHTAGAVSIQALQGVTERAAVLYPLQSLRKENLSYPAFPLLVSTALPADLELMQNFARSLSPMVQVAHDAERLSLHTAAVVVNNFTNHLYTLAADFCTRQGVDFNLLQPIIAHTAQRLTHYSPQAVQTGPALRNDADTMQKHVSLLQNHTQLKELYTIFSRLIQDYHNHPKV